jgi:hypothetical protein
MSTFDSFFKAVGPAQTGFQTDSNSIDVGADISGTQGGVVGRCLGPGDGDGVQGWGSGAFSGVAGFGDPATNGTGVFGQGRGPDATGVRGIAGGAPNTVPAGANGVYGQGGLDGAGVRGEGSNGVIATTTGGFNIALLASVTTPGTTAGYFAGNVIVEGDLSVFNGSKSAVVSLPDGTHRRLYCVESPESWFEDVGSGSLVDGRAEISFDPDFASTVHTDQYHVFITEYDSNNALYVTARSATGFEVRSGAGAADARFSYRVMAKRKDIRGTRFEQVELPALPPL